MAKKIQRGGGNTGTSPYIIKTNDGNVAYCGSYTDDYIDGAGVYFGRFYIVKLDVLTGDTIWTKKYGDTIHVDQTLITMIELEDGSLVATGITYQEVGQCGVMLKTTANGDSIWLRYYQAPDLNPNLKQNLLYHIQPTNDNGFIACGYMIPDDTTNQDMWVIKIDEFGCEVEGCQLIGVELLEDDDYRLFIYPNPAQDYVSIDLPITHNKASLQVYNMQGQLVKTIAIKSGGLQRIDTSELPNGIYQLFVSSNTMLIGRQKLVVSR